MKNLNQTWMSAMAVLFGVVFSSSVFAQSTSTPNQPIQQVSTGISDEDHGNPPPPPILSTKISELEHQEVEVYPNPNNGDFTLKINDHSVGEVVIIDLLGNVILKKNLREMNEMETKIDLGNVSSGIYLLSTGKEVVKFRVL
jgi:hypothetical protein